MKPRKSQTVMTHRVQLAALRSRTGGKQPGRKYGPAPKGVPAVESPGMGARRREDNYRKQTGRTSALGLLPDNSLVYVVPRAYAHWAGLTPRQRRRSWKKRDHALRRGPLSQVDVELGSKGKEVVPA